MPGLGTVVTRLPGNTKAGAAFVPPPPPITVPRGVAAGITARDFGQVSGAGAIFRDVTDSYVVNCRWADFAPTSAAFDSNYVNNVFYPQLDWALANNGVSGNKYKVIIRPRLGYDAPAWVGADAGVGTIQTWSNHGSTQPDGSPAPGFGSTPPPSQPTSTTWRQWLAGLPIYWKPTYQSMVRDFYSRLWTVTSSHLGNVVEIDWPFAMTQYAEPYNQQFGLQENIKAFVDNGWNPDYSTFLTIMNDSWTYYLTTPWYTNRVACSVSYNPMGDLVADSTQLSGYKFKSGNSTKTIASMEQHGAICGGLAVWFNKSMENPWNSQSSAAMIALYQRMVQAARDQNRIIGFQTETLTKFNADYDATAGLTNVQDTIIDVATNMSGAIRVEIPVGATDLSKTTNVGRPKNYISSSFASTWSPRLIANGAGRWS